MARAAPSRVHRASTRLEIRSARWLARRQQKTMPINSRAIPMGPLVNLLSSACVGESFAPKLIAANIFESKF